MLKSAEKEKQFLYLATAGGLTIEEAFMKGYTQKTRKIGLTNLRRKLKAKPELLDQINKYKSDLFAHAQAAQEAEVEKMAADSMLTLAQKRIELKKIVDNEAKEFERVLVNGKIVKIERSPTLMERMKAIELDNKMAGHIAPTRVSVGDPDGNAIHQTPIIQITTVQSIPIAESETDNP